MGLSAGKAIDWDGVDVEIDTANPRVAALLEAASKLKMENRKFFAPVPIITQRWHIDHPLGDRQVAMLVNGDLDTECILMADVMTLVDTFLLLQGKAGRGLYRVTRCRPGLREDDPPQMYLVWLRKEAF